MGSRKYCPAGIMRPLVVLHGLFGSNKNWQSVSKKLSNEIPGKLVYAVDLRNHGCFNNPKAIVGPIESWGTLRNDLETFWKDYLEGQDFDLLGHSFVNLTTKSNVINLLGRSNIHEFSFNK